MSVGPVVAGLFVFVLATGLATALLKDALAAVIVFAAYSLGMAVFYAVLRAPDVAMTEAAIGAGVTTVLLVLTLAATTRASPDRMIERPSLPATVGVGAFLAVLLATVPAMPAIGDPEAPVWAHPEISQAYLARAYADTGVENAVTAVLAGYRGFDTFGEAVVVFAAALAALVVLRRVVFTGE